MSKHFARLLFIIFLSINLSQVISVEAQGLTPTPGAISVGATTPIPGKATLIPVLATPTPFKATLFPTVINTPASVNTNPDVVSLQMMGLTEIQLTGPYDSFYTTFGLPANWKLNSGATLNLRKLVTISMGILNDASQTIKRSGMAGGTLTVMFNDVSLAVISLEQAGEIPETIKIPPEALVTTRPDGQMTLGFILDAGVSCEFFDKLNVVVHTDSFLNLPHDLKPPSTDLTGFPRPIYQASFVKDYALLVIPDKPSAAELQSALTISAGLGNLSTGKLNLDLTSVSKLTAAQQSANHIIYVGTAATLPNLDTLKLPIPINQGVFKLDAAKPDEVGVVQMVNSPWESSHTVLVVSGNTDKATIKAAQAVSSGTFRSYAASNVALVAEVKTTPLIAQSAVDKTLADLGYTGTLYENRGYESNSYTFTVTPGWTLAPDASFQMIFGHSALLNYNRSGITVLLNNTPIGSVRMSDVTAANSTNKVTILLPSNAIVSGQNTLEVQVNLIPIDDCTPPIMRSLWANIWPESILHLPLIRATANNLVDLNLGIFPAPFTYYPELENVAFVLQHDDLETWRSASQIAKNFGTQANGTLAGLAVFYGDNVPTAERSKFNFLIMGQPDKMPLITDLNSLMPIPFANGSNNPQKETFQVTYLIPSTSPMGYLETFLSPWNPERVVLAVLGNTQQGLKWASSALTETTLSSKLAGNFAVIKETQIITTDTRQISTKSGDITQNEGVTVVVPETNVKPAEPVSQRPAWILPAIIVLVALIIIMIISALISRLLHNRRNISK